MSRCGNCWNNAVAESFFSSLKKERIRKRIYKTRDLARADLFDYIKVFGENVILPLKPNPAASRNAGRHCAPASGNACGPAVG